MDNLFPVFRFFGFASQKSPVSSQAQSGRADNLEYRKVCDFARYAQGLRRLNARNLLLLPQPSNNNDPVFNNKYQGALNKKRFGLLTHQLKKDVLYRSPEEQKKSKKCAAHAQAILQANPLSAPYLLLTASSCFLAGVRGFVFGRLVMGAASFAIGNPYALGAALGLMAAGCFSYIMYSYLNHCCQDLYKKDLLFIGMHLFFGAAYLESDEETKSKIKAAMWSLIEVFSESLAWCATGSFFIGVLLTLSKMLRDSSFMPWQMNLLWKVFPCLIALTPFLFLFLNQQMVSSRQTLQLDLAAANDKLSSVLAYGQLSLVEKFKEDITTLLKKTNKISSCLLFLGAAYTLILMQVIAFSLKQFGFFSGSAFSVLQIKQLSLMLADFCKGIQNFALPPFTTPLDSSTSNVVNPLNLFTKHRAAKEILEKSVNENSFQHIRWDALKLVDRDQNSGQNNFSTTAMAENLYDVLDAVSEDGEIKGGYYEIRGTNGAGKSVLMRHLKDLLAEKCLWIPAHQSFVMDYPQDTDPMPDQNLLPYHQKAFLEQLKNVSEDIKLSVFSSYDKENPSSGQKVVLNLFKTLNQAILDPNVHYVFLDETYANLNKQIIDKLEPLIKTLSQRKTVLLISHEVSSDLRGILLRIIQPDDGAMRYKLLDPRLEKDAPPINKEDFIELYTLYSREIHKV